MKMSTNIRVATEASQKELYNGLKELGVVSDFHELFFVCACLGYKVGKKINLSQKDQRFWSGTIVPEEWACYYAMILEDKRYDYSELENDEYVIREIEKYANGGMKELIEDFLDVYLVSNSKDKVPQLNKSDCKELPKDFLHYLFSLSTDL